MIGHGPGSRANALGRDTRVCLRQAKAGCTIEQLKKTLGRTSCPTTTTGAVRPAMSRAAICSSRSDSPVLLPQSPPPRLVSSLPPRSPRRRRASDDRRRAAAAGCHTHDTARSAAARSAGDADRRRSRYARGHRRAAHSDRRERPRRHRGARRALHRPRAHRAAAHVARQLCRRPRRHRRLRAGEEGRAVRQARGARPGCGAHRHGEERRHRLHPQRRRVLQSGAHPHHPGHVLRSLLRRQRQLRRLGPDRLSRHPPGGHRRRAAHEDARQARARLGLCRRRLRHERRSKGGGHGHRP